MKSTIVAALIGAGLASAVFYAAPALTPEQAIAGDTDPPLIIEEKVATLATTAQYKMLSLAPYQNDGNTQRMEDALNKLAADGWRVQTGVGIALVLSR